MANLDLVVLRPGELSLKGGNRRYFEKILRKNLRALIGKDIPIERLWGRFYMGPLPAGGEQGDARKIAQKAARVFGVANTSPACRVETSEEAIARTCIELMGEELAHKGAEDASFAIRVRRADKSFPKRSMELARSLGGKVLEAFPDLKVDLENPTIPLGIEIRPEGSFVFLEQFKGAGGLPVGCEGRVLCLLSGGIDSPVAAWQMMKRGCRVDLLHFDSRPFIGEGSLQKVRRLAQSLNGWQGRTRLGVVEFSQIQTKLRELPKEGYRTVLYRRFMLRIAERIAEEQGHGALVTGDSLGQVASQTLENLRVVAAASGGLPIFRPLIGFDKEETMAVARKIGTYEISIEPFDDCCTLFQPDQPVTRGKIEVAERLEAKVDMEDLVAQAVQECRWEA